jgi:hypothetical protein
MPPTTDAVTLPADDPGARRIVGLCGGSSMA